MDGHALGFEANSFDMAGSQFGVMFLVRAVQSVRPEFTGPPMDPPPLPFHLRDPERLRRELALAGLRDVRLDVITESTQLRGRTKLWSGLSGAIQSWMCWAN